jgi:hypothetical protein
MGEIYKIVEGSGMGGFMDPPGLPTHRYSIYSYSSNRRNARVTGIHSITSTGEWIPEHIRERAAKLIADAGSVEPSELWIRNVYGYFRNMWTPDGQLWTSVVDLTAGRPDGAADDRHAAAVWVRKYFPDHEARTDLIADPGKGYGSYPCDRCGKRVQYEAKFDALTVVEILIGPRGTDWVYGAECTDGQPHTVS